MSTPQPELSHLYTLGVALALGLLIGLERGWESRERAEGRRIAGLRTYGLIGLLGGVFALLGERLGAAILGFGFLGLAVLLVAAYYRRFRLSGDLGITSMVAALLTFGFGALAVMDHLFLATAAAVVTTLLLDLKPRLHAWLRKLTPEEINASFELLLISVVLLPILPNQGYGPWQALNPYAIWWMVVLITGIGFIGYFAMKIGGARHGALLTGITGGLVSSTAVTLTLSRFAREQPGHRAAMASGILAACGTMFPRILLLASVINPALFTPMALPVAVATGIIYLAAWGLWRGAGEQTGQETLPLSNPFQIGMAIRFSLLLAAILLLSEALREWLGDAGLYLLAAISGMTDVDAITLSVSRLGAQDLATGVAVLAIFIAAASNAIVKSLLALYVGGRRLGWQVGLPQMIAIALGGLAAFLQGA